MTALELPEGTVTLLLTDVEGSTAALHALGSDYAASLALHRRVVLEVAAAHGGVEVDSQGDSFLIAFDRAEPALAAAAAIVAELESADWPAGVVLRARVGVHTGELERVGERYVGLELHRAARIGAAAHGGQVVVSAATRALGGDRAFLDLGHHRLKGFDRPERLFQLVDPAGRKFAPLRAQTARTLPRVPGTFVDRIDEVALIESLLRGGARIVTLTGAGGAGKSRLALEVAHRANDGFAHGAAFVRIGAVEQADDVPVEIADALGIPAGERPVEAVLEHLRERRVLLVLDNLEHVGDAAAALVAHLVRETERLAVLGTSRSPLRVAGEHVVDVAPLPEQEAVELFADRARSADHRFSLDERSTPDVRKICRRVDGLPLAIEIVAARIRSFSLSDLAAGLGFDLRTEGATDAPERHRTLEAAIAWGTANLEEDQRRLHAQLGVFQSRFTPEAAAFAFGASPDDLDGLVHAALLRRVDAEGPTRLAMLQTVRAFALDRLAR
ncbi:MAG: ATP-binding protein, partial [Gaiella sp.]